MGRARIRPPAQSAQSDRPPAQTTRQRRQLRRQKKSSRPPPASSSPSLQLPKNRSTFSSGFLSLVAATAMPTAVPDSPTLGRPQSLAQFSTATKQPTSTQLVGRPNELVSLRALPGPLALACLSVVLSLSLSLLSNSGFGLLLLAPLLLRF